MASRILISTSSFNTEACESLRRLAGAGYEIVKNPYGRRLTESEVAELLRTGVVGVIAGVEPLTRAVLTASTDLRVISRCGIGMDSVDLEAAGELGIVVRNTPDAPGKAVAELTLGLILNLLRHVSEADRRIRDGQWKQMMGRLLSEQTVGLIGVGRIGKRLVSLLGAFGCRVLAHDKLGSSGSLQVEFCSLQDVLARSDVLSLHLPYGAETHHLLNADRIASMKKGALLINAARGGLVDEEALFTALESGHLGGAALDCFKVEPYSGPLIKLSNVVLTAHMGSYASEARVLMEREAADNLWQGLAEQGCLDKGDAP